MKKILVLITLVVAGTFAFTQENEVTPHQDNYLERNLTIKANPLTTAMSALGGVLSLSASSDYMFTNYFGLAQNFQTAYMSIYDVNSLVFCYSIGPSLNFMGKGLTGPFINIQPGIALAKAWDDTAQSPFIAQFYFKSELGYQWVLQNGFTVNVYGGLNYLETFSPEFGVNIGYAFKNQKYK